MTHFETSSEGLAAINEKIDQLEVLAGRGLLNPQFAEKYIREIRSDLFSLRQTVASVVEIVNTAPVGA